MPDESAWLFDIAAFAIPDNGPEEPRVKSPDELKNVSLL